MASQSSTPTPTPDTIAPIGRQSNDTVRSLEARLKQSQSLTDARLSKLIPNLPIIRINKTMEQLEKLPLSPISIDSLRPACQALENPAHPARCTSVKVEDSNGKLILVYLGRHLHYTSDKDQPIISSVSKPISSNLKATKIIH